MQSGRSIGAALQGAIDDVRRRLDGHAAETRQVDQKLNELVARRSKALLDLAKAYLPNMKAETIEGTFQEVRDDLLKVLAGKERREREIDRQVVQDREELRRVDGELASVTEQLNEKVAQREALEKKVADRLHASDEFKTLSREAIEAERQLEANESRVAEVKTEATEKLPSYQASRLFTYLYQRGFGTPAYQASAFVRRIDRWVAKLINYGQAQRSYEFLTTTPELMAQEVVRRRDQFNALMEKVEAIEDQVSDELGLTDVMREGQRLGSQRDQIVAKAAKLQQNLARSQEELLKLERPENEFYEQAVARLQAFLASLRPRELEIHSRTTPQREDDAIVAEISWLEQQLSEASEQTAAMRGQRQIWDSRLIELQQILQRFREAEFDSRRSEFSDQLHIESSIESFLRGNLSAEQFWAALRHYQQFAPAWTESQEMRSVFDSDLSQVLGRVLIHVASEALRNTAYRGMQRRGPERQQQRESSGRPPFRKRGFTNGRGF